MNGNSDLTNHQIYPLTYQPLQAEAEIMTEDDEEFNPKTEQRKKSRAKPAKESLVETARQDAHILNEHHDLLVSGSLEKSFEDAFGSGQMGFDLSSSQIAGGFVFDDNFLGASNGFDLAEGLGDELAKELGWEINEIGPIAAWVLSITLPASINLISDHRTDTMDFHDNLDIAMDFTSPSLPFDVQASTDRAPTFSTPKRMPQETSRHVCISTYNLSKIHRMCRVVTRKIRRAHHWLKTEPIP